MPIDAICELNKRLLKDPLPMKNLMIVMLTLSLALVPKLSAANEDNFYTILGVGYATNSVNDDDLDELSYKLNIGYVLSRQWAIEIGFQGLGNSGLSNSDLLIDNSNFETADYDVNAFGISALGKAGNRQGELYYRLGLLQVNTQRNYVTDAGQCETSDALLLSEQSVDICSNDDSQIAGVIGLGFDFFVTPSLLLRTEIEHIQGNDDYSSQVFTVGLRFHF
jgi:opacity protein-like surface antigen